MDLTDQLYKSLINEDYQSVIQLLKKGVDPLSEIKKCSLYNSLIEICLSNKDYYSLLAILTSVVINDSAEQLLNYDYKSTHIEKLTRLRYRLSDAGYHSKLGGFRGDVVYLLDIIISHNEEDQFEDHVGWGDKEGKSIYLNKDLIWNSGRQ